MPDEDYDEFISLMRVIQLTFNYTPTEYDFQEVEVQTLRFSKYYERRYYRQEWGRLKACLPVFHQLLHVPHALQWAGPMYVYSPGAMERSCGTLAGMTKSRVSTNRNISNTLTLLEQKNSLVYVIDHGATSPNSGDEDFDGNTPLSNLLAKRIQSSRLQDNEDPLLTPSMDILRDNGPSRIRAITAHEKTCLPVFFVNEDQYTYVRTFNLRINDEDFEAQSDEFDIPISCRVDSTAFFNTRHHGDPYPFKATSSTIQRADQTRSMSFIRFEASKENHFGEVLFFFTIGLLEDDALARD